MNHIPVVYLASYFLSLLGNSIASIALPLIVLQTTGSVLGAGAVAAASAIPAVLAGLFMGVVIDRINRITSSVVTDLISVAAIAALPLVDLVTGLSIGWFVVFGVIGSLGDVPGMTARDALLPAIVHQGKMSAERLMGVREGIGAVAMLVGPAAAGTLMVLLDGSTVLWITAGTSLAAAITTLLIPRSVGAVEQGMDVSRRKTSAWRELREGWAALAHSRFLVTVTGLSLASVVVLTAFQGIILPVYFSLSEVPGLLGFVLSALALGLMIGGVIYSIAGGRGSRGAWLLSGLAGVTLGFVIMASLGSPVAIFAGAIIVGMASGLFGSLLGVLMIESIPDGLRGRIMGTQNALITAAGPAAMAVAAMLVEWGSLHLAAIAFVALWTVAALAAAFSPSLRNLDRRSTSSNEVRVASE